MGNLNATSRIPKVRLIALASKKHSRSTPITTQVHKPKDGRTPKALPKITSS